MQIKKHNRAFTIVEIVVVLAVIGIGLAFIVPYIPGYMAEMKYKDCVANLKDIDRALNFYRKGHHDIIRLEVLVDAKYLGREPRCPATGGKYFIQSYTMDVIMCECGHEDLGIKPKFPRIYNGIVYRDQKSYDKAKKY